VIWFNRTGGVVPMPERTRTPKQNIIVFVSIVSSFAWVVLASVVAVPFLPWFPIPNAFVIWLGGQLILRVALAFSIRRR
jgi:hypothetical protein